MARRRTKGTGSIALRGHVYWIEFQHQGRRLRESAKTSDPVAAAQYLQKRIGEVAAGAEIVVSKATVGDLCKLVLADYEMRELRNLKGVRWCYEANVERLLGALPAARF